VKFQVLDIVPHAAHPVTGELVSLNPVLPYERQHDVLRRFTEEIVPLVRRELSTTLWGPDDPGRARGVRAPEPVPAT
jgi:hypothetical protein